MPSNTIQGSELRARGRARDLQAAYASMEPNLAARLQAADQLAVAVECWLLRSRKWFETDPECVEAFDAVLARLLDWQEAVTVDQVARMQP